MHSNLTTYTQATAIGASAAATAETLAAAEAAVLPVAAAAVAMRVVGTRYKLQTHKGSNIPASSHTWNSGLSVVQSGWFSAMPS
jgi:hypothetical protein